MNLKNFASENKPAILRTLLIFTLIVLAAALRLAPHPWNFTPVGAIALFSGAMVRDRRLAFLFPLLVMFATDAIIGFNKLSPLVYASFLLSVLIGRTVVGTRFSLPRRTKGESPRAKRESQPGAPPTTKERVVPRIAAATLLGALQFFLITNFGVWAFLNSYPRTSAGLAACYLAGVPFFWNTLASDALYATLLFGGFALAERLAPRLRHSAVAGL
jgi:hypothetical protein